MLIRPSEEMSGCCGGRSIPQGYTLWQYNGAKWEMKKDMSAPGARPSSPPKIPGAFAGQIRATPSVVTA